MSLEALGQSTYEFSTIVSERPATKKDLAQFGTSFVTLRSSELLVPVSYETRLPKLKPLELIPDLVYNPHLKEAKFDTELEMRRFFNDINFSLVSGDSLVEAVTISTNELDINIQNYDREVIRSEILLPHSNRFDIYNGELRMVGNSGKPVVDAISDQERYGSSLQAAHKVEDFLLAADNNSFATVMSPAGWNGFVDENGQEAEPHLNCEVMVFWKDQNSKLNGLTIHVDLEKEKAKKVMAKLGVDEALMRGKDEKEELANIVRNPALLSLPRSYANPFEYVLDTILAERGNHDFAISQRVGPAEIRSVASVREDIKRFHELLSPEGEAKYLASLRQAIFDHIQVLGTKVVQQALVNQIEKTLLNLTKKHLLETGKMDLYQSETWRRLSEQHSIFVSTGDDDYDAIIRYLLSKAGCPASSSSTALRGISLGSDVIDEINEGSAFVERDADGKLEFPCHKCHRPNDRPRGGRRKFCKYTGCDAQFQGC